MSVCYVTPAVEAECGVHSVLSFVDRQGFSYTDYVVLGSERSWSQKKAVTHYNLIKHVIVFMISGRWMYLQLMDTIGPQDPTSFDVEQFRKNGGLKKEQSKEYFAHNTKRSFPYRWKTFKK